MLYQVNSFINSNIDLPPDQKRISICLRANGFSFSISSLSDVLLSVGEVALDLSAPLIDMMNAVKQFFNDKGIYPFDFSQMLLIVPSRSFVWIPSHLYDPDTEAQCLNLVSSPATSDALFRSFSTSLDAFLVFAADANIVSAFKIALPGLDVVCIHSQLVNDNMLSRAATHPVVLLYLANSVAHFEVFDKHSLLLSTSVDVSSDASQLLYRTLSIVKTLDVDAHDVEMLLSGDVDRSHYNLFRNFFPIVNLYTGRPLQLATPALQAYRTYRFVPELV